MGENPPKNKNQVFSTLQSIPSPVRDLAQRRLLCEISLNCTRREGRRDSQPSLADATALGSGGTERDAVIYSTSGDTARSSFQGHLLSHQMQILYSLQTALAFPVLSQSRASHVLWPTHSSTKKCLPPVQGDSPKRPGTFALSSEQHLHPLKSPDSLLPSRISVQQSLGHMTNVERGLRSPSSLMHRRWGCCCEKQPGSPPRG